jgi:hypothetical protein
MASERHSPGAPEPARPAPVAPAGRPVRTWPGGADEGGESACWAHLVCPGCGALESEGHLPRGQSGRPQPCDR